MQARGHRELPGALGCRRPEQRRLDLGETLAIHGGPDGGVDPGPQPQVALQSRPAQIDVAEAQAHRLVGLGPVIDGERRWLRLVEDLDAAVPDLDLAGADARVDGAVGALPHGAGHRDDPLAAHVGGVVDDALDDAGVIAQVDEGEMFPVLAAPGHPAAQTHGGADVGLAQHPAEVGAHGGGLVGGVAHGAPGRRCGCRCRSTSPSSPSAKAALAR